MPSCHPAPLSYFQQSRKAIGISCFGSTGTKEPYFLGVAICEATMKTVALILALAVISGCHARVLRQAEVPKDQWEENVERFWTYLSEINSRAEGMVEDIKTAHITRELDTLISETTAELAVYRDNVQTKLVPYTEETAGQLGQDLHLLTTKLEKDMLEAKKRTTQYLEDIKTMMNQDAGNAQTHIENYTRKLKKRLDKDTEEIRNTVSTYLGELQSRTYQNVETLQKRVEPIVSEAHGTAADRLGSFSSLVKSQGQGLNQHVSTKAEDLRVQVEATAEELRKTLEEKIDELSSLIGPFAAKINDQLKTIMDKVKETSA
ncbi:hypothetical protein DPEC_G00144860 [Dallia pectoralis]|uniref:Uncharacterized protein n=1 Tax=Dallia pectoralis TaxID=75939 RepID=A0ACC2GNP5_DALPE|nr:hypothetical protein DPEC_G00144860 [Dallia pectoralis]